MKQNAWVQKQSDEHDQQTNQSLIAHQQQPDAPPFVQYKKVKGK